MRKTELVRGKNTLCLNQSSLCVRAADMDFPMRRFRSPNSSSNRPQKKKKKDLFGFLPQTWREKTGSKLGFLACALQKEFSVTHQNDKL